MSGEGTGKGDWQVCMETRELLLRTAEFYYSTRFGNEASKGLAWSCGFSFQWAEEKTDWRDGEPYQLEVYHIEL